MLKIFNQDLFKNKLNLVRGGVCVLGLITMLVSTTGCKSNEHSAYNFEGAQSAIVNEDTGIYTITMSDGDVYNIAREDIDQTYDQPFDPMFEESWNARELLDTGEELDDIVNITSDSQYQTAIQNDDFILIKRVG